MKILIINYTRIGDSILSTALINHLLDEYPLSQVSIVTSSLSKDLFKRMPRLENLIVIDKRKYSLHWFDIWKLVINQKWDLTIDLRSSYLSYIIRTKKYKIFKGNDKTHKINQFIKFLNTDKKISPSLWFDSVDEEESNEKIIHKEGPFIAIAPYSNSRNKDWSIDKYLELFRNNYFKNYTLILTGISEDIPNKEKFENLVNDSSLKIINLFDWGNLRNMIPIFKKCDFFIGSDSGLMHLAASTKCKTFGLFGPTNEVVYGPWGDHKVIRSLNDPTEDDPLNLSVEEVLNAIKEEIQ